MAAKVLIVKKRKPFNEPRWYDGAQMPVFCEWSALSKKEKKNPRNIAIRERNANLTLTEKTDSLLFDFYSNLKVVLEDLGRIDKMIPHESSRSSYSLWNGRRTQRDTQGACIIEARKNEVLSLIQTIARDHIHFGKKLLEKWPPK